MFPLWVSLNRFIFCNIAYRVYFSISIYWYINQPRSLQIFSCSFWMGAIGGATAKRHRLWSNCKSILMEVDRRAGYLSREDMLKLPGGPLVRHYIDQNGKKRHAGIPGKLRDSQYLVHYSTCIGAERLFLQDLVFLFVLISKSIHGLVSPPYIRLVC